MKKHIVLVLFPFLITNVIGSYDGELDKTFAYNGTVVSNLDSLGDEAQSVAIQEDGKIIAIGSIGLLAAHKCAIARYQNNGTVDDTFGAQNNQWWVSPDFGRYLFSECTSGVIQNDQKIVSVGSATNVDQKRSFAIARFNKDGTPDTSFNPNGETPPGTQITDFGGSYEFANALTLQSDGKIVAAGATNAFGFSMIALVRYNGDGTLDTSFNNSGLVVTKLESIPYGVAIQEDGKIVIAGQYGVNFILVRYTKTGQLDSSFGLSGVVIGNFGGNGDLVSALVIQKDNKIVICGTTNLLRLDPVFALARFNEDGSYDKTFGSKGVVITSFGKYGAIAAALALQADQKFVVSGSAGFSTNQFNFALARYYNNGTLDTSFNPDSINSPRPGTVITKFGQVSSYARGIALQKDGKIVIAGGVSSSPGSVFGLARYIGYNQHICFGAVGDGDLL